MQDLVAEYQQYQDATYVLIVVFCQCLLLTLIFFISAEEEVEYEEELPVDDEQ